MRITLDDIEQHRPDVLLPPDAEFAAAYADAVRRGREAAAQSSVAMVAICRNAMPWLQQTLGLVEETGAMFGNWSCFMYENDSEDQTKAVLAEWQDGQRRHASLNVNRRPHLSHTISRERTEALAEYRTACQEFVRHGEPVDYVIVFDTDAWGGWSVDGVATSVAHILADDDMYGLASYSWGEINQPGGPLAIHYDAFAARLNHWTRRDQQWFHLLHPAVGSPPVRFNSAFGQLALYKSGAYLQGRYAGTDCEHVCFHRSIPGGYMALNPSSRCVSFWVQNDGGQDRDD